LVGCGYPPLAQLQGDANDACTSFASLLDTCQLDLGDDLLISGAMTYDTGAHMLTPVGGDALPVAHKTVSIGGGEVDVISARDVVLMSSATLRGVGSRPLAIVASGTITIGKDAQIDVGASGAGAQTACVNPAMLGKNSPGGGSGGGGGGFGGTGGTGGIGDHDTGDVPGGAGGAAVGASLAGLRGGCPGARGGNGSAAGGDGGAGGAGGGALYLVALERIQLDSATPIQAGGGGGRGGGFVALGGDAGGGGGGSGGMLVLEAPRIRGPNAVIAANGGGGGEGSDGGGEGANGSDGPMTSSGAPGGGGKASAAGDGGRGGSLEGDTGETPTDQPNGGGGGGGGGAGIIKILSGDAQIQTVSPKRS
jgi:hypothetical protein